MKQQSAWSKPPEGQERAYVLGSLIVTGAGALIVELVGARVLSPYYGSSIYCWSAQITVTLISLAAGYHLGGRWADRGASLTLFARLITWSAAGAALVPVMRAPVLSATTGLGVELGALTSALALFAPSLVLLGAVGPVAVKLQTQGLASVGRGAGDVYSISTVGSVLGAMLAGFALIPHFPISKILYGLATVLLALGALGSWLSRQKLPLPQLAAAMAVALYGFWPRVVEPTNMLVNRDSAYGQIKVLDFGDKRYLLVNGTTQSLAELPALETDSQYSHSLEWAALQRPAAKTALVIGIGAGLLPKALEKHYGLEVDSVDIDPAIVETARDYFGFHPKGRVAIQDGRLFVRDALKPYDLVFVDAFGTETPPYHLFTVEAFHAIGGAMAPNGLLAVNLVSKVHGDDAPWLSAARTLRAVFPNVRVFLASETYEDLGNVLFFCSNAPIESAAPAAPRSEAREHIAAMLKGELPSEPEKGLLMTDDFAPLESLVAKTALVWRATLQKKAAGVLLY